MKNIIIQEIKNAKSFPISVDSTPDINHIDQLSLIIWYVNENRKPVEQFLCFIDNAGVVLSTIESFNFNINNLRGQSYDNASNMSGIYSGLQAKIKAVSPLAQFLPCSAHFLN